MRHKSTILVVITPLQWLATCCNTLPHFGIPGLNSCVLSQVRQPHGCHHKFQVQCTMMTQLHPCSEIHCLKQLAATSGTAAEGRQLIPHFTPTLCVLPAGKHAAPPYCRASTFAHPQQQAVAQGSPSWACPLLHVPPPLVSGPMPYRAYDPCHTSHPRTTDVGVCLALQPKHPSNVVDMRTDGGTPQAA